MLHGTGWGVGAVFVAGILSGCGSDVVNPPTSETPPFVSGTRLRARVLDGGDGAVVRIGWQDTKLDLACRFLTASDGSTRCLPDSRATSAHVSNSGVVYADAECTTPLFAALKSDVPPFVVGEPMIPEACGAPTEYTAYTLGAPVAAPTKLYQRHFDDCNLVNPVSDDVQFYAPGPAVPPELFVRATESHEPRGSEVAARIFQTDDGTREVFGAFDLLRSVACSVPQNVAVFTGPCLPLDDGVVIEQDSLFSDDTCSDPAAVGGVSVLGRQICEDTVIAVHLDCDGVDALQVAAGEVEQPYVGASESCTAIDVRPGNQYFALGASVDLNAFPQLGVGETGDGALTLRWTAAPNGSNLVPGEVIDTARGVACGAQTTCDGLERCVPLNPGRFDAENGPFADPECTEPVEGLSRGPCNIPLPDTLVRSYADCSDGPVYYERGEIVTDVYVRDAVDPSHPCVPSTQMLGEDTHYYRVGAPIPLETFPALTERVE